MAATLTKEQILDGIAELSVIELSELLKEFEEKFGVTAAAPWPLPQLRLPVVVATLPLLKRRATLTLF